jgi:CRISPR-associated endonuclease/helicase Cas3
LLHEPVETLARNDGSLFAVVLRDGIAGDEDISDEDISSSRTVRILLNDHNAGVGSRARRLATLVGLDADQCETLGCAGDVHDVGKADPRFQRLLGMRQESASIGDLLAKGTRRSRSNASEQGERHEAYSVALIRKYPTLLAGAKDKDLATYLIGTHHGRGRGLMPTIADAGAYFQLTVKDEVLSFEGAPQLSALNSQWANLFWRLTKRYGAWGLAYLEAVLRLADHLQSRDEITGAIRYD